MSGCHRDSPKGMSTEKYRMVKERRETRRRGVGVSVQEWTEDERQSEKATMRRVTAQFGELEPGGVTQNQSDQEETKINMRKITEFKHTMPVLCSEIFQEREFYVMSTRVRNGASPARPIRSANPPLQQ